MAKAQGDHDGPAAHAHDHRDQRVGTGYAGHPTAHAVPSGEHADHDKHAGHSVAMFRNKFWLPLLLTIPTLVWGHMLQVRPGS